jgi:D-alanyl-lipoteichoic acid acyltransferase DltB (MBOAT superfamily)
MPPVLLGEYVTYVVFFPALSAGPIDRVERFVQDLRNPLGLCDEDWLYAVQRLLTGMFKKFVLADSLAYVALNAATATTVQPGLWTWTLLYAYSFQIFFDFSGYTDIAIGMARLVGVKLPENFNFPYLKSNLTQFWNNWHITLTQWFRGYFFNPLTRAFRSRQKSSPGMIIFIAQISTMLLIGLWHGVTLNFVLWGLWHGAGLFLHNRWSNFAGVHVRDWASTPSRKTLLDASGVLLTFNFVSIGWVFFSMPTLSLTWVVLSKLIG